MAIYVKAEPESAVLFAQEHMRGLQCPGLACLDLYRCDLIPNANANDKVHLCVRSPASAAYRRRWPPACSHTAPLLISMSWSLCTRFVVLNPQLRQKQSDIHERNFEGAVVCLCTPGNTVAASMGNLVDHPG
jgi:hypothetical protein